LERRKNKCGIKSGKQCSQQKNYNYEYPKSQSATIKLFRSFSTRVEKAEALAWKTRIPIIIAIIFRKKDSVKKLADKLKLAGRQQLFLSQLLSNDQENVLLKDSHNLSMPIKRMNNAAMPRYFR
jgi:hypothetical protein